MLADGGKRTADSKGINMKKVFIIAISLCAAVGLFVSGAYAETKKFEVSLSRSGIALGETTQLGLSFYETQSMPAPDVGNIDGLDIKYTGPSTMMTVINGQVSSSITHMYSVQPLRIGKFQLGPFSFKYKGNEYISNMAMLEVSEEKPVVVSKEPEGLPITDKLNLDDRIFLTLTSDKTNAYVNELIPVTVKLYVNRLNVSDIQLPVFSQEGFSKIEFKEPKQFKERSGNTVYDVLEFKTQIFGMRPGDYRLGPAKIKCNIVVKKTDRAPGSMRDDFFGDNSGRDSFFDDFFTRYERYPLELKSQDIQLIVSPLPNEGRPNNFSGAVGDYQFIFAASPTKLKAGDPITLKMDINGRGNFNTVLAPVLDNTTGFKVYEPEIKTEENRKSFTQVLIPETDQVVQLPKALFNYFDPIKKEYKTITQGGSPIQVEKGKDEAPSRVIGPAQGPDRFDTKEELARDIIYIKDAPGRWIAKNYQIYRRPVFLILVIIPLIELLSVYFIQRRRERLKKDLSYASRIYSGRSAKKGLTALRHQLKTNPDPKIFYETFFKALQSYLGSRLNMQPVGITYDAVEGVLRNKEIDLDVLRKIKKLFMTCDEARFAFLGMDAIKMNDDIKEFQDIINYFERKRI